MYTRIYVYVYIYIYIYIYIQYHNSAQAARRQPGRPDLTAEEADGRALRLREVQNYAQ